MQWRFYLIDRNGKKTLVDEPAGWERLNFKLKRHAERHGTFREVQNINIEFYNKGAQLLKREYDQHGIRGQFEILIEALCGSAWLEWYRGKISFANYTWVSGEICSAAVDVDQKGGLVKFLNRFDQQVEVGKPTSFDGVALTDYINLTRIIELPSKTVQLLGEFVTETPKVYQLGTDSSYQVNPFPPDVIVNNDGIVVPYFDKIVTDGVQKSNIKFAADYYEPFDINDPPDDAHTLINETTSDIECLASETDVEFRLKGSFDILVVNGDGASGNTYFFQADVFVKDSDDNTLFTQQIALTGIVPTGDVVEESFPYDISNSFTTTLDPGEKLFIYYKLDFTTFNGASQACEYHQHAETFLRIRQLSLCEPTKAKLYLINETISRVIEAISDNELKVFSEYYGRTNSLPYSFAQNGCGSLRALTTGMDIRGVKQKDGADPALFISMKDLFEDLSALDNIGMGMDGDSLVRIENWKHFYKPTIIHQCTGVDKITYQIKSDEIYSIFRIGYDKWEAEEYNGLDEFLTQREFRTSLSQVQNTLEKMCRLITSGYAIEVTRRKFNNSKDWRYDQDKFLICLKEGGPVTCDIVFSPTTGFLITPVDNSSPLFGLKPGDTFSLSGTTSNNGVFTVAGIEVYNMAIYVNTVEGTTNETASGVLFTAINNPFYQVNTGNITNAEFIVDPSTIYNFEISPIRMAMKWFDRVMACFKGISASDKLIFSSAESNYKARGELISSCRQENGILQENQDIALTDFNDAVDALPINETERVTFRHPLTTWEYRKISDNPDGLIYFSIDKSSGEGWIDELTYSPNEGLATFTLIPKSSNHA
jgi:hypothetical protein